MNKTIGSTMTRWHEYLIGNREGRVLGRRGSFISVPLDSYWSALIDVSIGLSVITLPESNTGRPFSELCNKALGSQTINNCTCKSKPSFIAEDQSENSSDSSSDLARSTSGNNPNEFTNC